MFRHPIIYEQQTIGHAGPEQMDALWAEGWRHFGTDFFRYSITAGPDGEWQHILPLRIDLAKFSLTKSQRRLLRKNEDLRTDFAPARVTAEREALFLRHRERFTHNIPDSLSIFLPPPDPAQVPCACLELRAWNAGNLVAVSYLDTGRDAVSSVYGMFEPDHSWRSPGIYTMLMEIRHAAERGCRYLYPGYATIEPSHYDYKKQFRGLEYFDWQGQWRPLQSEPAGD